MKEFETIIILKEEETDTLQELLFDYTKIKLQEILEENKIKELNNLGIRNLAYEVKGNKKGFFIQVIYLAEKENVNLNTFLKENSFVLKYITVCIKDFSNQGFEFDAELKNILDIYTNNGWENEPLDGDEIDKLCGILKAKLNLINGNITEQEYFDLLD